MIARAEGLVPKSRIGELEVAVHPVARQAAHIDAVEDGLSTKFSIAYCVAHAALLGPPRRADFEQVNQEVAGVAARIGISLDRSLPQFGASLRLHGRELACVLAPRGTPENPDEAGDLAAKVADLAGDRLDGIAEDVGVKASRVLAAAGLTLP